MPAAGEVLFHLLLAFVLSTPLAWVYVRTHQAMSYSRTFVQSLVLLALIVALVMLAIGDSMARAFGLFGALALIRFRTPIKDSRDAVFLFLAVAIGIMVGVQNPVLAVTGTAMCLGVTLYLHATRFGQLLSHDGVLRLSMPSAPEHEARLRNVLTHYCRSFVLMHLRASASEQQVDCAWQLRLRDPQQAAGLVHDVRAIPGAAGVSLLVQSEHEEL